MGTLNTANINLTGNFDGNQPRFRASLDQNRTTVASGYIKWNHSNALNGNYFTNVEYNVGNGYNSSNTTFTAPASGLYYWKHVMATNGSAPATGYTSCEYYKNGTRRYGEWQKKDSGYQVWSSSDMIVASAGDVFEFGGEWQGQITFSNSSYISMYMLG